MTLNKSLTKVKYKFGVIVSTPKMYRYRAIGMKCCGKIKLKTFERKKGEVIRIR